MFLLFSDVSCIIIVVVEAGREDYPKASTKNKTDVPTYKTWRRAERKGKSIFFKVLLLQAFCVCFLL